MIIKALKKDGFELDCQNGSHQQYRHPIDKRGVAESNFLEALCNKTNKC